MTRIFVSRDPGALSVGAESVGRTIEAEQGAGGLPVNLVRNGSRGLYWLEPLVEVETPAGRVGYGPVSSSDVPGLFQANFLQGGAHALALGDVERISYFQKQERLTFARVGTTD